MTLSLRVFITPESTLMGACMPFLFFQIRSNSVLRYLNSRLLLGLSMALISNLASAQTFQEGVHYTVLNNDVDDANTLTHNGAVTPVVVEYFSFSCPGCAAVEPSMRILEKSEPKVDVQRVHMPFGGAKAKYSQKAFALMQLLDAGVVKDKIFTRIHRQRNTFDSDDEIIEFFTEQGYEQSKVAQTLASFSADTLIRKMNKEAARNKIKSVPTIIVNGKYQVSVRQLSDATTLTKIVNFLSNR